MSRSLKSLLVLSAMCVSVLTGLSLVVAAPPNDGISGDVMDVYESGVSGAYVQLTCGEFWVTFATTNGSGSYSSDAAAIAEAMGDSGCEDGSTLSLRAGAEGFDPNTPQTPATVVINFDAYESVSTLQGWALAHYSPAKSYNFVLDEEEESGPEDGWYGYVYDDDSGDPIEGAELTVSCTGGSGTQLLATTDGDGYYEISQNTFVSAFNYMGCYYSSYFDIVVGIAKEGYDSDGYSISEIDSSNMGGSFAESSEMNFWLYPEQVDPATYYDEGDGSEDSPFIIDTVDRMNAISLFDNSAEGLYFELGSDIEFNDDQEGNYGFAGSLEGNGYTISGATMRLFSRLEGDSVVKNLFVDGDIFYQYTESDIGILAGIMSARAYVENVHTSGSILMECGLYSCFNFGGLVGAVRDDSTVYRSSSSVVIDVRGNNTFYAGGLVGTLSSGTIAESYATGNVRASSNIGGFVGAIDGDASSALIRDSYATGDVYAYGTSFSTSGGFAGEIYGMVISSYSIGSVFASSTQAGGFAGSVSGEAYVSTSFSATESVVANERTGGFIGAFYEDAVVRNNAWLRDVNMDAIGLVDETTQCAAGTAQYILAGSGPCNFGYDISSLSQLKQNGYDGGMAPVYEYGEESWNFESVWGFDVDKNEGLPYLRWGVEGEEPEVVLGCTDASARNYNPSATQDNGSCRYSSGGSSSGSGGGSGYRAPAGQANSGSATIEGLIAQYRDLLMKAIAAGISLPQNIVDLLNAPASSEDVRDLEYGMQGDDVRKLQVVLIGQGYSIPAGTTGLFLEQTRSALAAYQLANGIVPSAGYFGSATRSFMKAAGLVGLWW